MMIVKQVYLDHLNRPVGSFEALKSGLINKSQTTHDRLEKIWKKNGENVEQKWRKCGAKMELIRKESGENPEKTKRDVGRTVFSCYCLFVGFPQIPATSWYVCTRGPRRTGRSPAGVAGYQRQAPPAEPAFGTGGG